MLDGCYNCRLSCQQSCLTCTTIGCTSCQVGFKLINRYCRNICGDSMIVEGEDCDDGNQYPFDGCHQCVYQCQSECLECLNGICFFCIDGFEAFNGICQECQQGYLLNNLQNICDFQKKNEIVKIQIMDVLPQLIQYCQIQINNQCIICYKNFKLDIFTNKCEPICGDGIISGTEECEDNNYLVLDGCYQCKYQCSETCEICEFGKCIFCQINTIIAPTTFQCEYVQQCTQPGSYYNQETNQCYSICGDGFVYLNEECDDGNDIEYDGCHKCYYSCQPGCKCVKGECYREQISCENGLYYSFTSLSCKPFCGDGITIQPFEECDDGNEISDDECNLCKLQCGVNCQTCSPQNYCLQCKEGYELFDFNCYEYNNSNCKIKNCEFCENNECLTCFIGYQLFDNMCFSQCGDGVLIDLEQCDDGNLINGDGCDDDCTQSENSICRDNECAILSSSFAILEFEREQQGVQFIRLKYSSKMRLIAGVTEQDYFDSLKFEIQNEIDLALIQIIAKTNITQELQFVDIQVSVEYIKYVQNPILLLKFVDKGILVNQDGAGISQDSISIRLSSSNILRDQEQKVMTSLIGLNDYIIKFVAMTIAISSISGQGEIISNLLDTIQQLYYLKYINSRIGVNLQRFYETFKIIQLTNFFDFLGMNPNGSMKDIVSFYHSKPIFEMDDRNANYLNNFAQLFLVYAIFFLAYFCLKKVTFQILKKIHQLTCFQSNQILLLIVNQIQKLCLRIQIISIIEPIQAIFLAMIYEFGLNTFLALRFQKSDFEGKLGVSIAISILYGVIILLIQISSFSIPLLKKQQIQSQKINSFTYLCMQKMLFISFLIFFFESSQIQILLCLLNEFQFIYFLYIRKILMLPSENIKQLASHFLQFIILGMYLVNDFYQDQPDVLIIIGWGIISLMSTILFMTLIIDLIKIVHPIWQKCKTSKTSEHHDHKQEIFCIVENPCNAQRRFTN
ncbi:unnamed protein product [Paramecium primaurelia]|uniref:Transmembrane protein n=1 Tax=Paramecium primaurelia TaxID=5886 RepID=A0A8S1KBD5_PARPR|nr:unnamed protein product [Paramecium primaurelia]